MSSLDQTYAVRVRFPYAVAGEQVVYVEAKNRREAIEIAAREVGEQPAVLERYFLVGIELMK